MLCSDTYMCVESIVTGECIDYDTCTLKTPSGYQTHWSGVEEVRNIIKDLGMEEVVLEEKGKGVLCAFRKSVD